MTPPSQRPDAVHARALHVPPAAPLRAVVLASLLQLPHLGMGMRGALLPPTPLNPSVFFKECTGARSLSPISKLHSFLGTDLPTVRSLFLSPHYAFE